MATSAQLEHQKAVSRLNSHISMKNTLDTKNSLLLENFKTSLLEATHEEKDQFLTAALQQKKSELCQEELTLKEAQAKECLELMHALDELKSEKLNKTEEIKLLKEDIIRKKEVQKEADNKKLSNENNWTQEIRNQTDELDIQRKKIQKSRDEAEDQKNEYKQKISQLDKEIKEWKRSIELYERRFSEDNERNRHEMDEIKAAETEHAVKMDRMKLKFKEDIQKLDYGLKEIQRKNEWFDEKLRILRNEHQNEKKEYQAVKQERVNIDNKLEDLRKELVTLQKDEAELDQSEESKFVKYQSKINDEIISEVEQKEARIAEMKLRIDASKRTISDSSTSRTLYTLLCFLIFCILMWEGFRCLV
jgi:hypothetical protein